MSEVLRLHCVNGRADIILILTDDNAFYADVQKDEKGEFILLPDGFMPKRKQRKVYLMGKFQFH